MKRNRPRSRRPTEKERMECRESKLGHATKDKRVISIEDAGVRGYNPALKKKEGKKERKDIYFSTCTKTCICAVPNNYDSQLPKQNIASFLLSENHD